MEVTVKAKYGSWSDVLDSARVTVGKTEINKEPSSEWKRSMLLAEHSPIRDLHFKIKITDLKSWISVHFVRHHAGVEHYVKTQRSDRTGVNRDDLPQSSLVVHEMTLNPQAMIFISRKRLCHQASLETRTVWRAVIDEIAKTEPEIASVCVRECVYRGFCSEMKPCGYAHTEAFQKELEAYRNWKPSS